MPALHTIVLASRNAGKRVEFQQILGAQFSIVTLPDDAPEVVEDRETFHGNALKKASEIAVHLARPTLADDSGLVVPALGGHPGVRSARFAGPGASDDENTDKLLADMKDVRDRRAYFICTLALCSAEGALLHAAEGRCHGVITESRRGDLGFGYDPVFLPDGFSKTMAELTPDEKNAISHRGFAAKTLSAWLAAR